MISLMLGGLAVAWLVLLAAFPRYFARPRPKPSTVPRYHYYVCGDEELPTWQRMTPGPAQKKSSPRQ